MMTFVCHSSCYLFYGDSYLSVYPADGQVVQVSDGIVAVLLNYALRLLQIPNITKITYMYRRRVLCTLHIAVDF